MFEDFARSFKVLLAYRGMMLLFIAQGNPSHRKPQCLIMRVIVLPQFLISQTLRPVTENMSDGPPG